MALTSKVERSGRIRKIINHTIENGRMTVNEAASLLGVHRRTAERYFRAAVSEGNVIRYGRLGLFRDQRAIIDFDLVRFSYNKSQVTSSCKK